MRQLHALHRLELPAFHLFAFRVVKRRVYLGFTSPTYFGIPVRVIHEGLREERWVDARVDPPTHAVGNAK